MKAILDRIHEYQQTYTLSARGHYLVSERQAHRNYWLGVPSIVISAMVGASIFASVKSNPELVWKIITGFLSLSAAVLASLQTFFHFAESAETHLVAGHRYGVIRRRLELLELKYRDADISKYDEAIADLTELNETLEKLGEESPAVPDKYWDKARIELAEQSVKLELKD